MRNAAFVISVKLTKNFPFIIKYRDASSQTVAEGFLTSDFDTRFKFDWKNRAYRDILPT